MAQSSIVPAHSVFATLTPTNERAKRAFSSSYEYALQNPVASHLRYMSAGDSKEYDEAVDRFFSWPSSDDPIDDEAIENAHKNFQPSAFGHIWAGYYKFALDNPPENAKLGWSIGTGCPDIHVDFISVGQHVKEQEADGWRIEGRQAVFNFHAETGYIGVIPSTNQDFDVSPQHGRTRSSRNMRVFNQRLMTLNFHGLAYSFEYTQFAGTDDFDNQRKNFMRDYLGIDSPDFGRTPIPLGPPMSIGKWTLGVVKGRGKSGTVCVATNPEGTIVAIKGLVRSQGAKIVPVKLVTSPEEGEDVGDVGSEESEKADSGADEASEADEDSMDFPQLSHPLYPIPSRNTLNIGDWTTHLLLGKGISGDVYSATNWKAEMVAIKLILRDSGSSPYVQRDLRALREMNKIAEDPASEGRLRRLKELMYQTGKEDYDPTRPLEYVILVLEPVVEDTFERFAKLPQLGPKDLQNPEKLLPKHYYEATDFNFEFDIDKAVKHLKVFGDALKGIQFLHSRGWIHGHLNPRKLGIQHDGKAVLLDLKYSIKVPECAKVPAAPGRGGSMGYIAPERELMEHNHLVDIWSMGVILFQMTFGYHPWLMALNPWSPGQENEDRRPTFNEFYGRAMAVIEAARHKHPGKIEGMYMSNCQFSLAF
jgi:serine/threonine protein kinase